MSQTKPSFFRVRPVLHSLALVMLAASTPLLAQDESEPESSPEAVPVIDLAPINGQLVWPKTWTVFAPMVEGDAPLSTELLQTIPEKITVPAFAEFPERVIQAKKLEVDPGSTVDFMGLFPEHKKGNTAYIFLELDSPSDQTVSFGIGGDWWVEVWVNGKPAFDTLEGGRASGNKFHDINILNHRFEADLKKGRNILVVRYITGRGTALVAVGGPSEFAAAVAAAEARLKLLSLNEVPKSLADRLVFPVDTQAIATASMDLQFPVPAADLLAGSLVGLQEMPARQMMFSPRANRGELLNTDERRFNTPVFLRLSKFLYPWEDRHLDAILYTTSPKEGEKPAGSVEVLLKSKDGKVLSSTTLDKLSPNGLFFSVGFPEALQGSDGVLEAVWRDGAKEIGRAAMPFKVEAPSGVSRTGKIPLRLLNEPATQLANAPMTVGVPFPRGALDNAANVRLVDGSGREIPVQSRETGRWSRFGPVKWILCDFTADLDGKDRELFLEYGPDVRSAAAEPMKVSNAGSGFLDLDAGRIKVTDQGVLFDVQGDGKFSQVLAPAALSGAFVTHEKLGRFSVPADAKHEIEELGSEKAIVRRTGWFVNPENGSKFCQYVTRLVFHRDSPVIRIFHTWIFTGDGNRDRIREMGWRFDTVAGEKPGGFLKQFGKDDWLSGNYVVQFDFDKFRLSGSEEDNEGRLPGVLNTLAGNTRVLFGAKDFWQSFPSELAFEKNAFTFLNWPRHNPPARLERPIPKTEAFRNRFVHEGELLDFRIPEEYLTGEIFEESAQREFHWSKGRAESVNAQGLALTEEMFLFLADPKLPLAKTAGVMRGLNDETLRAVVDPGWVASSGAFGKIHPFDPENYPEEERMFDLIFTAPGRWAERLGFYGKFLHGDYATWSMNLEQKTVSSYRAIRKNHHTWPYRWVPFARSGNPTYLKFAESATRQMTDANFCHFASQDVDDEVGEGRYRRQGWWLRSLIPWVGRGGPTGRSYTIDTDYLWDAYYLTGYSRARDVLLLFQRLAPKAHEIATGPRATCSMLSSYIDMYEGTFDPWFLAASCEISDLYDHLYGGIDKVDRFTFAELYDYAGHGWRGEQQKWANFTGHPEHRRLAINNADAMISPNRIGARLVGTSDGDGGAPATTSAYGWLQTGDTFYLRRLLAELDSLRISMYEGDIEHYRGAPPPLGNGYLPMRDSSWSGPFEALAAIHGIKDMPEPIPSPFMISPTVVEGPDDKTFSFILPVTYIQKKGPEIIRVALDARGRPKQLYDYEFSHLGGKAKVKGQWEPPVKVELPADAPDGSYEVKLSGNVPVNSEEQRKLFRRRVAYTFFPLTEPDVPEVISFPRTAEGTQTEAGALGYWFLVPKGTREFWIDIGGGSRTDRFTVWSPERERIYDGYGGRGLERQTIKVKPGQDGQLWRATGGSFRIDPAIPPYFSVTRNKWFNPTQ